MHNACSQVNKKPAVPKQMTGRVRLPGEGFQAIGYFTVSCPDAPAHLRILYLEGWALRSAKPGDRVELEYRKTGRGSEWVVTQVLS